MNFLLFPGGGPAAIAWIALPFFVGFLIYLIPKLDRYFALGMSLVSAAYALQRLAPPILGDRLASAPLNLQLLDHFGVTLVIDSFSSYFILTNALVTAAVVLYCWRQDKSAFFYTQAIILHGSVNAAFVCADFISLYVALEVISIAAFLLIAYPRSDRAIWVGLRYLFVSNVAMLFYLIGAVLVYQATHSFAYTGLRAAPPEAIALIFVGLLTKGGIFVSGLWLPLTHAEAETPVSALLSGIVVKTGVFALMRCALLVEEIDPLVRIFGVGTALLGVCCAIPQPDTKRTLAFSTVSQLGWILAAPQVGGFYALGHGLVKSALFLIAGALPSRNFKSLKQQPIPTQLWLALGVVSLSISGFPLLIGFGAKILTLENLRPWQAIAMNLAATGTVMVYAKFIFLPHQPPDPQTGATQRPSFWLPVLLLIAALFASSSLYVEAYTLENILKVLGIIGLGWLAHFLIVQRSRFSLSPAIEQFEHLIGGMSLMLILLFWMVFIWVGT